MYFYTFISMLIHQLCSILLIFWDILHLHPYAHSNIWSTQLSITIIFACNIFFVFCLYLYVLLNSVWEITTQEIFSEDPSFALLPNVFSMLDAKRMYDVLVSSFSIFFKNDDSKMLLGQILTVFDSEKTLTKTFYFAPRVTYFLSRVTATLLI